jgi:SAM-dependent methyltransferase
MWIKKRRLEEGGGADRVISNGAINLSPAKSCVSREVFRILKPGGRFWSADMVRESATAPAQGCGSWADCVAGTVAPERILEMLAAAGFRDAELVAVTGYKSAPTTTGAIFRACER